MQLFTCFLDFPGVSCQKNEIYYYFDVTTSTRHLNQVETCSIIPKTFALVSNMTESAKNKVAQFGSRVSSEKDVETLLDYINWKLFVYVCENSFCNSTTNQQQHFQHLCAFDASCCFTNSYKVLIPFSRRCKNPNCINFLPKSFIAHWYIFLVLGLFCLFGNFVVIYQKVNKLFCKNQTLKKNNLIYNILVLNLSSANLLMGVYLVAISLEIKRKLENDIYFSNHSFCNFLGVISTVSTQASISILAVISFYRLVSLTFPYKTQHVKVVVGIVALTWLIWLIVALLPTIPLEPLVTKFTFGISKNRKIASDTLSPFKNTVPLIENLKSLFTSTKSKEINLVLEAITKYPTRSVLSKVHDRFGWIDLDTDNWFYVGYYNLNYICTTNFFVNGMHMIKLGYFGLSFAVVNLFISFAIFLAYVFITLAVFGNEKIICTLYRWCKSKKVNWKQTITAQHNTVRLVENQVIRIRIAVIIITDLFFVAPLSAAALVGWLVPLNVNGNEILKSVIDVQTLLLFVVPFNSIINPYIYSFMLWKNSFTNLKKKICKEST